MARRTSTIGMVALTALAVCGCGGSSKFANGSRPPLAVNLTVYINDVRISVSPSSVSAGPAVFLVTNHASRAEGLSIQTGGVGSGQSVASTAPINPGGTAQVQVNLNEGSGYVLTATSGDSTQASQATPGPIQPAQLTISGKRSSSRGTLMTP